jgi:hypothetical protein
MQQQELRVCLFITQESIHAYVRNLLHPQIIAVQTIALLIAFRAVARFLNSKRAEGIL